MPVIELLVHQPLPRWQHLCAGHLAALPGVSLRLRPVDASSSRLWRGIAGRCGMLKASREPLPATTEAAAETTIDLAGGAGSQTCWRLRQGDGRPLAAPFPFAQAWSRAEALGAVHLVDETGRTLRSATLSVNGRLYPRMVDDVLRAAALLPALAWRDRLNGVQPDDIPAPLPAATASPAAGLIGGGVRYAWSRLAEAMRIDLWRIGLADRPIHAFLDPAYQPRIEWITPAEPAAYCADPFAHPDDPAEIWWERYDYRSRHGVLQRARLGSGRPAETVDLGVDSHMSFPCMLTVAGRTVLIPEMSESGTTRLYSLDAGGRRDCLAVLPVPAIDPVLFEWEGRLWLGMTRADIDNRANFCLWHAPSLSGPWTEHNANPVKIDVRSARGGGTPFRYDGALYRPTQDCSLTYGGQVVINRVLACSPTEWREEVAAVVRPQPDWPTPDGLHTLSACGERTLIDAKVTVLNGAGLAAKVGRVLGRREKIAASQVGNAV